jgi:hypothetical protein
MNNDLKDSIRKILNHSFNLEESENKIILKTYEEIWEEERSREYEKEGEKFEEFQSESVSFDKKGNKNLIECIINLHKSKMQFSSYMMSGDGNLSDEERIKEKENDEKLKNLLSIDYFSLKIVNNSIDNKNNDLKDNNDKRNYLENYYIDNKMEIIKDIQNKLKNKSFSVHIYNQENQEKLIRLLKELSFFKFINEANFSESIAYIFINGEDSYIKWITRSEFNKYGKYQNCKVTLNEFDDIFNLNNFVLGSSQKRIKKNNIKLKNKIKTDKIIKDIEIDFCY